MFESLNTDSVPVQLRLIGEDQFELTTCTVCKKDYQPEHRMLLSSYERGLWIVMYPSAQRQQFSTLEHGVKLVMADELVKAPKPVAEGLFGIRPQLVFGQARLAEAVRCHSMRLEPALLECAKLIVFRERLGSLINEDRFSLCFDRIDNDGAIVLRVQTLDLSQTLETIRLPTNTLKKLRATRDEYEAAYPALFRSPFVCATRYLFGSAV